MTATSHAIIGTVIAAKIGNPALAIPIALGSHVVADLIPHWDTATNSKKKGKEKTLIHSIFDVGFGIIIVYLLVYFLFPYTNLKYAYLIVFFAQLPDWLMAPYYFFKWKFFKIFYDLQKKFDNRMDKPWGIINQVAFILAVLVLAVTI